jgi:hypothetical protein
MAKWLNCWFDSELLFKGRSMIGVAAFLLCASMVCKWYNFEDCQWLKDKGWDYSF